ncbi:MAG: hypothetical protein Q8Q33_01905 [Chlamydiota bacterium]|nr:hypothetical protein [Chlamydiota bacterium]
MSQLTLFIWIHPLIIINYKTMKKAILIGILALFPYLSFAAPLTQEQANSLITVVQAFPGTPASVFTNLITVFSNITVKQAESLITVIQSAPSVPANAFVGMLIAFTEDQPIPIPDASAQKIIELNQKVDTLQNQLTQTNNLLGVIQQNTIPPPPAPPPLPPVDKSEIIVGIKTGGIAGLTGLPSYSIAVSVLDKDGKSIPMAPFHWTWLTDDSDYIFFKKNTKSEEEWDNSNQKYSWENRTVNGGTSIEGFPAASLSYLPTVIGIKTLIFAATTSSAVLSKTVIIEVK